MSLSLPSTFCSLAIQHQDVSETIPINASVNVNQDIVLAIKEVQGNSALVGRYFNTVLIKLCLRWSSGWPSNTK